ncbi:peptidase inhibitor family I36 protein [Streptosporangium sp. NBC_01755]|uniref:peptidase inhibitor family I36 protein n=1 Tax=unclassified Streptosporangium TaxID=2632669 RepID=UPI002DD9A24A|nr:MULTISPECIES: peptidase inhibitor family I36 protein [unclassified Streptosporangium]WSA23421.1 peptidase inhibitor family I36 protein [Streptosporangium sp. NBC_01810]WSC98375.1 peptidase inhibitor family I36 protein [Streptosporangium sp. NBC_01755]
MGKISSRHPRLARTTTGLVTTTAALLLASGTGVGTAAAQQSSTLPPRVIQLEENASCPFNSLCLYRDYGFNGPGYSIPAGYPTDLNNVPMPGGVGGTSTAANNVSSWINNTGYYVQLIDYEGAERTLYPGYSLEEPPDTNDSVDAIDWLY